MEYLGGNAIMRIKKEYCNLETLRKFAPFEDGFCEEEGVFSYEIEEDSMVVIDADQNGHCQIREYDCGWLEWENEIEEYYDDYNKYKDDHERVLRWEYLEKVVDLFDRMKAAGIVEEDQINKRRIYKIEK